MIQINEPTARKCSLGRHNGPHIERPVEDHVSWKPCGQTPEGPGLFDCSNCEVPMTSFRCTHLFLLLLSTPALAQGDPEAGRDLVRRWCTACHVVELEGTGTDAGPPLPALLAGKQRSADEIRGWLADPHPPMPNLDLSRQEIDDILAYLQSLSGD